MMLSTIDNDPRTMEIGGDRCHAPKWPTSNAGNPGHAEKDASAAPASLSSRAVFARLTPFDRQIGNDQGGTDVPSIASVQTTSPFDLREVPIAPPALRLDRMERVFTVPGPLRAAVYRAADGVLWQVTPCPGPVCNTLVTCSIFFRREGIAAAEYRHVETSGSEPAIARRVITGLDTSLDLLSTPELSRTNGVYEGHMLDEWLDFHAVGDRIGIDRPSNRSIRFDLRGILTHDERGMRKAHFDLDTWRFGNGKMPAAHPLTFEIFRALPTEFIEKGALHVVRYDDGKIAEIIDGNYLYDEGKRPVRSIKDEVGELLAGRRDQMQADIFGPGGGYPLMPRPLTSAVSHDDPAIEYLRHASWPFNAALDFIKLQFPQAVFHVDADGTKETIAPGARDPGAFNTHGFEVEDDPRFVRVYDNLDNLSAVILSHYGPAGWAKAKSESVSPIVLGAAESTIVAAGDPHAPSLHVYVFVPEEEHSPFTPDPFLHGALRTDRPFKPLLTLEARPDEVRPDMYTLPDLSDRTHPYYWEALMGKVSPLGTVVFPPNRKPLTSSLANGVPLDKPSAREIHEMRRKHSAMNAYVDRRHPYAPGSASTHNAAAVMLELDEAIWLAWNPAQQTWRLPSRRVKGDGTRAEVALDAAHEKLGLIGPILGHLDDIENEGATEKTRYFILRRHAGAPFETEQKLPVARVSIEEALAIIGDPVDAAALRALRSQLTWPNWHEQAREDEVRLIAQPGAYAEYESGGLTHPYSQLTHGIHRVYRRQKIAREPRVFRGKINVDGRDVFYTGRRSEMYVSLPGKPKVKKTSIEFERDGAGPDEPTIIFQGGGPGASPAWYLGGGLGPIRVDEHGNIVSNNETLLLGARLLFVDALGTGDSFTDGDEEEYFNIEDDADITAEYMMRYRAENMLRLKDSPLFAVGTSYGVQRWGRAVEQLTDAGVPVGGVVFVSGAMSYQLLDFAPESAISYACALIPYAATARQHLPEMMARYPDEDAFLAEVEKFAFDTYLPAIAKGTAFERENPKRFSDIAETLSDYIGLSLAVIKEKHLQITQMEFCTMLLPGETIAALDGRMRTRSVPDDVGNDPFSYALAELSAKYQKALTGFFRDSVGYRPVEDPNRPYVVLDPSIFARWDWGPYQNSAARVQDFVTRTARKNPQLKWLMAAGKYDVRAPAAAHAYALNHLPPDVATRVEFHAYNGGHMFYMTDEQARKRFIADVLAFIARQTKRDGAASG